MNRFFAIFALLTCAVFAQDYNGSTTPSLNDSDVILLRKIAKALNDARTGSAPLSTGSTLAGTPAVSISGTPTVTLNGSQLTPAFTSATSSGSTTAGKKVLIFILSADFTGTIGGVAFTGSTDSFLELRAPEGSTFSAVAYTRSAGTIRVVQF